MGRGRTGYTTQSNRKARAKICSKYMNAPEDGFVRRKCVNNEKTKVEIKPEVMNLLQNADPALLVNFLTS